MWANRYEILLGLGAGIMCVGIGMMYRPAAVIFAGLVVGAFAILGAMGAAKGKT